MSYTQHMPTQYIRVHYSRTVHYGASESGGSITVEGTIEEPVDVVVHVDTDRFDHEISECNGSVQLLTGSVVATEAAQVESVRRNSRRVGDTIIAGFFKTVRSDITQQIAALQSNIDSLLIHLRELSARCLSKKEQMHTDYQRISSRYLKIFDDLDQEMENRIHAIDAPVFDFTRKADSVGSSTMSDSLVAASTVGNAENARLHARISAAMAKRSASEAIRKSEKFLDIQHSTDRLLANCLRDGGEQEILYAPYCMVETTVAPGQFTQELHSSPLLDKIDPQVLGYNINECPWQVLVSPDDAQAIAGYFNSQVAEASASAASEHDSRVAAMTARLFNLSQTATTGV